MDIFRDDLFKNKYFVAVVVTLIFVGLAIYFLNYNSVESRCERYVQGLVGSMRGPESNRLEQMQLQNASKSIIEECIKRGGP